MKPTQIPSAVSRQESSRFLLFFSVAEKRERMPGKGKRRDRISALRKEKYAQTIAELDKSKH